MYENIIHKLLKIFGPSIAEQRDWSSSTLKALSEDEHKAFSERMAPVLKEFEQVRQNTHTNVVASMKFWMPLAIASATVLSFYGKSKGSDIDPIAIFGLAIGGAVYMAANGPRAKYRSAFKDSVVPHLFNRFGMDGYSTKSRMNTRVLETSNVYGGGVDIKLEDEFSGTYRGRSVGFAEMSITSARRDGDEVEHFNGVAIEFELPGDVGGRTIIFPASYSEDPSRRSSFFGSPKAAKRSDGLEPVTLEDPGFAKKYSVLTNDQVGARVLLSPAFMERLVNLKLGMSERSIDRKVKRMGFFERAIVNGIAMSVAQKNGQSINKDDYRDNTAITALMRDFAAQGGGQSATVVAIAEGGRLLIAIPKSENIDYFEPPPYYQQFDTEAVLMHMSADIQEILNVADAIFELDHRTRSAPEGIRLVLH